MQELFTAFFPTQQIFLFALQTSRCILRSAFYCVRSLKQESKLLEDLLNITSHQSTRVVPRPQGVDKNAAERSLI